MCTRARETVKEKKRKEKKEACLFIPECRHLLVHGSRRSRPERFRRPRGILRRKSRGILHRRTWFLARAGREIGKVGGDDAPWPTHRRPRSREPAAAMPTDPDGGRSRCPGLWNLLTCRLVPCFAVLQFMACQSCRVRPAPAIPARDLKEFLP
jgi:hypothetical protein